MRIRILILWSLIVSILGCGSGLDDGKMSSGSTNPGTTNPTVSTTEFSKTLGGPSSDGRVNGVVTDKSGNIYVVGIYTNSSANSSPTSDFNGNAILGKSSSISSDVYVAKINASGTQEWIKTLGGSTSDSGEGVALDSAGNVYVVGNFSNSSANATSAKDFADNSLLGLASTSGSVAFIAKLDSEGTQQWIRILDGAGYDTLSSISITSSNVIYLSGYYTNSTSDGNSVKDFTGAALLGTNATASNDIFVAQMNTSGVQQWLKVLGGSGSEISGGVAVNQAGTAIYTTGYFRNSSTNTSAVVDFAGATLYGISTGNGNDGFVAKLDSTGTQQWVRVIGGNGNLDFATAIHVDRNEKIYVGGTHHTNLANGNVVKDFAGNSFAGTSSSATQDVFVAQLDASGIQQWIIALGGNSSEGLSAIKSDTLGENVYILGSFANTTTNQHVALDFTGASLLGKSTAQYLPDTFLAKVNSSGSQQWIKVLGGNNNDIPKAIDFEGDGKMVVGGYFINSLSNNNNTTDFYGNSLLGKTTNANYSGLLLRFSLQ